MNFKRTKNPISSLNIGRYRKISYPKREDWMNLESGVYVLKYQRNYISYIKILWEKEIGQWSMARWSKSRHQALIEAYTHRKMDGFPFDFNRTNDRQVLICEAQRIR